MKKLENKNCLCWGLTIFLAIVITILLFYSYQRNIAFGPFSDLPIDSGECSFNDELFLVGELLGQKQENDDFDIELAIMKSEFEANELISDVAFHNRQELLKMQMKKDEGKLDEFEEEEFDKCLDSIKECEEKFIDCMKNVSDRFRERVNKSKEDYKLCRKNASEKKDQDINDCFKKHKIKGLSCGEKLRKCLKNPNCKKCVEEALRQYHLNLDNCKKKFMEEFDKWDSLRKKEEALCNIHYQDCIKDKKNKCFGLIV